MPNCRTESIVTRLPYIRAEHLFIFPYELLDKEGWLEQNNEILFQFSTSSRNIDVIECGVQILTNKTGRKRSTCETCESVSEQVCKGDDDESLSDGRYEQGPIYYTVHRMGVGALSVFPKFSVTCNYFSLPPLKMVA